MTPCVTRPSHLTPGPYFPALNGYRGIAALMVLFHHLQVYFLGETYNGAGPLAVDFFFMLSGFIISHHYQRAIADKTLSFRSFIVRRAARLYPAYLLSLLLVSAINLWVIYALNAPGIFPWDKPVWCIALHLTLLQSTGWWQDISWVHGSWSLSVEWLINIAFFFIIQRYRRVAPGLLLLGIYLGISHLIKAEPNHINLYHVSYGLLNLPMVRGLVDFSIGMLLFQGFTRLPYLSLPVLWLTEVLVLIAVVLGFIYHESPWLRGFDYGFVLFAFPALMGLSFYRKSLLAALLSTALFQWLGAISYSLYILHQPLQALYERLIAPENMHLPLFGILFFIAMLCVATLSYVLVEVPGRRWIRRYA